MPMDLRARVLENAYRILNVPPTANHLEIRRAADRALRRVRFGMPLACDDHLPPLPAAVQTEARVRNALARLLVPATRLEERVFCWHERTGRLELPIDHRLVHSCALILLVRYWHWGNMLDLWDGLLDQEGLVAYLIATDGALPVITPGDVERLRERWDALLLESALASLQRHLGEGDLILAGAAIGFLVARARKDGLSPSYRHGYGLTIEEAVSKAFMHAARDLRSCERVPTPADVERVLGHWQLVVKAGIQEKLDRIRHDVLRVIWGHLGAVSRNAESLGDALAAAVQARELAVGTGWARPIARATARLVRDTGSACPPPSEGGGP